MSTRRTKISLARGVLPFHRVPSLQPRQRAAVASHAIMSIKLLRFFRQTIVQQKHRHTPSVTSLAPDIALPAR